MYKNFKLFFCALCFVSMAQGQQDTLIYDPSTGNYIIRYMRENPDTGELDSLVQVIFVPATKINPSVKAWMRFVPDSNVYVYNYEIANGSDSKQNLILFLLEFGEGVNVEDKSTQRWYGGRHKRAGIPINRYDWIGNQGLQPTWKKGGFVLESSGIPGIGNAYFQGNAPIIRYPFEVPYELDRQIARLEVFPANHVKRQTIVPVAPPSPFVPLAFLDTLVSYKHQAFALGWIKNQGIIQSLDAKLENAQAQLRRNNTTAAKNILQAFINEVEALWKEESPPYGGTQITSEAYALLKFNAEYLISKL